MTTCNRRFSIVLAAAVFVVAAVGVANAQCVTPTDGMVITADTTFCSGVFDLPNGIVIAADDVTVAGDNTVLRGPSSSSGDGVSCTGHQNVTIRDLTVRRYRQGLRLEDCDGLLIEDVVVEETYQDATRDAQNRWVGGFLNIFDGPTGTYGHALWLRYCDDAVARRVTVNSQQNGVGLFDCTNALVEHCTLNDNSGWGVSLYRTTYSTIQQNMLNDCTRIGSGYNGGDAAALLMVMESSYNDILDNVMLRGGDGVFLAGSTHELQSRPNNHNYFARNDCSYSPNNGFEGTFSQYNIFEDNISDYCNYGYWLGYSSLNEIRNNQANHCSTAGVAIEHGDSHLIEDNVFASDGRGVWLWTDPDDSLVGAYPSQKDSHSSTIRNNEFASCQYGVYLSATGTNRYSYGFAVTGNRFEDCGRGLYLSNTTDTDVYQNFFVDCTIAGVAYLSGAQLLTYDNYFHNAVNAIDSGANAWSVAKTAGTNIVGGAFLGGNYWSDYTGRDNNGDGLGDTHTPYDAGGQIAGGDNAPLIFDDPDCNYNGIPDAGEADCNGNGQPDECDIEAGLEEDCNENGVPDQCDLSSGASSDCDANGVPDECDPDCNDNGVPDVCDLAAGTSDDCDGDGVPDECPAPAVLFTETFATTEFDPSLWIEVVDADIDDVGLAEPSAPYALRLNGDPAGGDSVVSRAYDLSEAVGASVSYAWQRGGGGEHPDSGDNLLIEFRNSAGSWQIISEQYGGQADTTVFAFETVELPAAALHDDFALRIRNLASTGPYDDWFVDDVALEIETLTDCNGNGVPDACDIASGFSQDLNGTGVPDECEEDCNLNGIDDADDIATGYSDDCDDNNVPDECQPDCNANGVADACDIANDAIAFAPAEFLALDGAAAGAASVGNIDANLDVDLDIVIGTQDANVAELFVNNGGGTFADAGALGGPVSTHGVTLADVNDDGRLDLLIAQNVAQVVEVMLGDGDGGFTTVETISPGNDPLFVDVADFDGDENVDLVISMWTDAVAVALGAGDGTFGPTTRLAVSGIGYVARADDLDDDGDVDIAVANLNALSVLLNQGDGSFAPEQTYAAGTQASHVLLADFDGDDALDAALANEGSSNVSVLLGAGDGTFGAATNYPVGTTPRYLAAGHFDLDATLDLAVANRDVPAISILLGSAAGDGSFQPAISVPTIAGANAVVAGEFNGDAATDLAVVFTDGSAAALLNTTTPPTSYDVNGNGIPDECEGRLGDTNCDGVVNSRDIDSFVMAIVDAANYQQAYPDCMIENGDCNADGEVNSRDIDAFVALVVGS